MIGIFLSYIYLVILLFITLNHIDCVWNRFDLVRWKLNGFGYTRNIPYTKILYSRVLTSCGSNQSIVLKNAVGSNFGISVANIGDLDENGVDDIAVGASLNSCIENSKVVDACGSIFIIFLNNTGEMIHCTAIGANVNGGPILHSNDQFGYSLATLGMNSNGKIDLAVGAPGLSRSAVYILSLYSNGTVCSYYIMRGPLVDVSLSSQYNFDPGLPVLSLSQRWGSSVANIGDLNQDGISDIAIGTLDQSNGNCYFYIIFLYSNYSAKSWVQIGSNLNGGPFLSKLFSNFGRSIQLIGDVDHDGILDLAVGSQNEDFNPSGLHSTGSIYILFMFRNGSVKSYHRIAKDTIAEDHHDQLPLINNDQCGSSLAFIGDINHDEMRQHYPSLIKYPIRLSINDLIMGCPSPDSTGKLFLVFLSQHGFMREFTMIPSSRELNIFPTLPRNSRLATSMTKYQDLMGTNISGLVVGAPGDDNELGSVYLMFIRRRQYHPPFVDKLKNLLIIVLPCVIAFLLMLLCISYFFYHFRRRPDDIEIFVKSSGFNLFKFLYVDVVKPIDLVDEVDQISEDKSLSAPISLVIHKKFPNVSDKFPPLQEQTDNYML